MYGDQLEQAAMERKKLYGLLSHSTPLRYPTQSLSEQHAKNAWHGFSRGAHSSEFGKCWPMLVFWRQTYIFLNRIKYLCPRDISFFWRIAKCNSRLIIQRTNYVKIRFWQLRAANTFSVIVNFALKQISHLSLFCNLKHSDKIMSDTPETKPIYYKQIKTNEVEIG